MALSGQLHGARAPNGRRKPPTLTSFVVVLARGKYPFPFRTRQSSLSALMILQGQPCGKVSRRHDFFKNGPLQSKWAVLFCLRLNLARSSMLSSVKGVYRNGRVELLEPVNGEVEGDVLVVFVAQPKTESRAIEKAEEKPEQEAGGWFGRVRHGASAIGATVGSVAATSGNLVVDVAAGARGVASSAASHAYEKASSAGAAVSAKASVVGLAVSENAYPLLAGLTSHAGHAVELVTANPTLQQLAQAFKLERWLDVTEQVDIEKAQEVVAGLKAQFPKEGPDGIAHRLMLQKAMLAGGVGLSTSLLPGSTIPLMVFDLAATALLQAELVYQIAAAYDLDLEDPARKGEVLAVFGCVLGAQHLVKAGLGILKSAPAVGAVIGATTNAAMVYTLGHVACKFYEEKLHLQPSPKAIEAVKQESELFLSEAVDQEAIIDQVLVHIFLAGQPNANREELLDALHKASLSPISLEAISASFDSPLPLDDLLLQLHPDFATYLFWQCQRIAQMDEVLTEEEKDVMNRVALHMNVV